MVVWLFMVLQGCQGDNAAGQAALDAHDLAGAEAAFRRALSHAPDDPRALAGLGWTYLLANQMAASATTFSRCTLVAPRDAECFRGLASVSLAEGNLPKARTLIHQAQQLSPEDPQVLSSVALLELYSGELTSAEGRYRQLVRRHPEEAEYHLSLARLLLRTGGYEEVLSLTESALALSDTPVRYQSMLWVVRAQALLASSVDREDPARCAETVPPVLVWLKAAETALEKAEATGVSPPDLVKVRRQVLRRQVSLQDACPAMAIVSE